MILFKVSYRKQNDNTEYDANILSSSPEQIQRELENMYGELTFFRCWGRNQIDYTTQDIEKTIYNKVKKNEG